MLGFKAFLPLAYVLDGHNLRFDGFLFEHGSNCYNAQAFVEGISCFRFFSFVSMHFNEMWFMFLCN